MTTLGATNTTTQYQMPDGWISANETWTYASASTFTISGVDVTAKLAKGTFLRFKQGAGYKYATVASVAFSTNTTVTIIVNTDYTIANAAITDNDFSYEANPQGWPDWFNYAVNHTGFSAAPASGIYRYKTVGKMITVVWAEPNAGTSNAATYAISSPVAAVTIANMLWIERIGFAQDNGAVSTTVYDYARIASAGTVIDVYKNNSSAGWTTSGTKRTFGNITYEF